MKPTENENVEDYRMPEELIREHLSGNGRQPKTVRRYPRQNKMRWYQFPPWVLDYAFATTEARRNAWPVLATLMALEEFWFTDFDHHNPVRLSSYYLRRFGLDRHQKSRALEILEKAKVITVDRRERQSPLVSLGWHLLQH